MRFVLTRYSSIFPLLFKSFRLTWNNPQLEKNHQRCFVFWAYSKACVCLISSWDWDFSAAGGGWLGWQRLAVKKMKMLLSPSSWKISSGAIISQPWRMGKHWASWSCAKAEYSEPESEQQMTTFVKVDVQDLLFSQCSIITNFWKAKWRSEPRTLVSWRSYGLLCRGLYIFARRRTPCQRLAWHLVTAPSDIFFL